MDVEVTGLVSLTQHSIKWVFCEHGNDYLSPINDGEFIVELNDVVCEKLHIVIIISYIDAGTIACRVLTACSSCEGTVVFKTVEGLNILQKWWYLY
jgi:hypothetical protein